MQASVHTRKPYNYNAVKSKNKTFENNVPDQTLKYKSNVSSILDFLTIKFERLSLRDVFSDLWTNISRKCKGCMIKEYDFSKRKTYEKDNARIVGISILSQFSVDMSESMSHKYGVKYMEENNFNSYVGKEQINISLFQKNSTNTTVTQDRFLKSMQDLPVGKTALHYANSYKSSGKDKFSGQHNVIAAIKKDSESALSIKIKSTSLGHEENMTAFSYELKKHLLGIDGIETVNIEIEDEQIQDTNGYSCLAYVHAIIKDCVTNNRHIDDSYNMSKNQSNTFEKNSERRDHESNLREYFIRDLPTSDDLKRYAAEDAAEELESSYEEFQSSAPSRQ